MATQTQDFNDLLDKLKSSPAEEDGWSMTTIVLVVIIIFLLCAMLYMAYTSGVLGNILKKSVSVDNKNNAEAK